MLETAFDIAMEFDLGSLNEPTLMRRIARALPALVALWSLRRRQLCCLAAVGVTGPQKEGHRPSYRTHGPRVCLSPTEKPDVRTVASRLGLWYRVAVLKV